MNINDDEALGLINRLLERLHQADLTNFGSHLQIVYVASGGQHVETQINIGNAQPKPETLPKGKETDSAEASKSLPEVLATDEAMTLWRKAQRAGYVDEHYQPAERLGIKEKWKVFGDLWKRNNMRGDYTRAMNQRQSLSFQDKLKRLFSMDNEEKTGKT